MEMLRSSSNGHRVDFAEPLPMTTSPAPSSPRHSPLAESPTDYVKIEPMQRRRSSSGASLTRAAKFFGMTRIASSTTSMGRSRSGSELSTSSGSRLSSLGTPLASMTPPSGESLCGSEALFPPHMSIASAHRPTMAAPIRPPRPAPPVVCRAPGLGQTVPLEEIPDSPPPSPTREGRATLIRRRSSELLRALSQRAQAALDAVPRTSTQLQNRVRRRPSDMSLEALATAPKAQRPMLHVSRSSELLARINPLQLFGASSDSLATALATPVPTQGFSSTARAFGSVTQLNKLLRIEKAPEKLLPAFVATARNTRIGSSARTETLRAALKQDAALGDAAERGLLALYEHLFVPRPSAKLDEELLARISVRQNHRHSMWHSDHGVLADTRAAQLLPRFELMTCKVGLERMLTALIFMLEPPGGPEVLSQVDLGHPEPLSVEDWQCLLAPWGAFVTPEEIAATHRMGQRRDI